MTRTSRIFVAVLAALVVSGLAFSQSFLGNMFKLGETTTAARPASSSTIRGALLYDTDVAAPIYNTGSAWSTLGGSSGPSYWSDAGAGRAKLDMPAGLVGNASGVLPDGGYFLLDQSSLAVYAMDAGISALFASNAGASTAWELPLAYNVNIANVFGTPGIAFWNTAPSALYPTGSITAGANRGGVSATGLTFMAPSGGFMFAALSNQSQVQITKPGGGSKLEVLNTNANNTAFGIAAGAYLDFGNTGGGANDYVYSDGTGLQTPSYLQSTYAFASGAGLLAPRVRASGGALTAFTAAAATSGGVGTMAWDSTTGSIKVQQSASAFEPIGQPHIIYDGQTYSTRVASVEVNATPQIAERVNVTSTATLQMYWTYTAGSSGTQNSRSVYALLAGAGTIQFGTTANSVATTTLQRITHSGLNPTFCQRVRTDVITSAGLFAGLASVIPVTGGSAAQTGHFAYLYGDVGAAAFWQLCTRDGTTTGCTNTTAALAASTDYSLCFRLSTTSCDAFVNGVYVGSRSTNLPASGTGIAPVVAIEAIGTSKTLYVGPMQVETQ